MHSIATTKGLLRSHWPGQGHVRTPGVEGGDHTTAQNGRAVPHYNITRGGVLAGVLVRILQRNKTSKIYI